VNFNRFERYGDWYRPGMPNAVRLLAIPCILLALFLIGAPAFPALDRAVSKAFAPAEPVAMANGGAGLERSANANTATEVEVAPRSRRSRAVLPLYVSFAALQVLDAQTTLAALDRGAVEGNPMMRGLADNRAALFAVKAGTTAGAIYLAERVRARSPVGALLLMGGLNSLYAAVVANNYRVMDHGNR
jgi:hypothetical protein